MNEAEPVDQTRRERVALNFNFRRSLPDDGLHLQMIKEHSFQKLHRHNYYAEMFARGMKKAWPQRVYLGLYSGSGRAKVEGSGEIVETTAMSVLQLPDPFTQYIFVDHDRQCIDALQKRCTALGTELAVKTICSDVNSAVELVRAAMPRRGAVGFCFVDPFDARLRFNVLREISQLCKMDFLILLALGMDIARNLRNVYFTYRTNTRIADLIDDPHWRSEYESCGGSIVRFVLNKFNSRMTGLGYLQPDPKTQYVVRADGRRGMLYILAYYSKHPLGHKYWGHAITGSSRQTELF